MKVLVVLLLCVLLFTGCEVAKSEPDYDARISALEKAVADIQDELELNKQWWYSQNLLEDRVDILEDELDDFWLPAPSAIEYEIFSIKNRISKIERLLDLY